MCHQDIYASLAEDTRLDLGGPELHLRLRIHELTVLTVAHTAAESQETVSVEFEYCILYTVSRRRIIDQSIVVIAVNVQ